VTVDRKAGTIRFPAKTVRTEYELEFLVCKAGTKEYESILSTQAGPRQIHAGLLMLGLTPGKPAQRIGTEYLPPRGAGLSIELTWKDKAGKAHTANPADWLKMRNVETDKEEKPDPQRWIFLGSEVLPSGRYWAEVDGGIIAVANLPSAVIDVPFTSPQALDARYFEPDRKAIPPLGTEVEVTLRPEKGAQKAPHARVLCEIDRFGRVRIDGRPIPLLKNALRDWALKYTSEHAKGMVVIRSAGRAMSALSPLVQTELKIGGVFEFEHQTAPLTGPLLPRTLEQIQHLMDDWEKRFSDPENELTDPGQDAKATLAEIRRRQAELQAQKDLLDQYARQLNKSYEAFQQEQQANDQEEAGSTDTETGRDEE
jgi:hypothetical protein